MRSIRGGPREQRGGSVPGELTESPVRQRLRSVGRRLRSRWIARSLSVVAVCLAVGVVGADAAGNREWLQTVQPSPDLQTELDGVIDRLVAANPGLSESSLRVAVLDIDAKGGPRLAARHGDTPVYPASVVKFVYLMAAFAWVDRGQLEIDPELDRQLREMIYASSNKATQKVVRRLTNTRAGPALSTKEYDEFRDKRLSINRWLDTIGIEDLHCMHPTYDGGGDLHGRDRQLLQDGTIEGGLPATSGEFKNRQSMTAVETAKLLALLATDRALSKKSSAEVRRRMLRDPTKQKYLRDRIAGGAKRCSDSMVVESKTGTFGRIIADAGIVRGPDGRELVIVVFIDSSPRYRGSFIADLSEAMTEHVLGCSP